MLLDKQTIRRIYKLVMQLSQENKTSCPLQVGLVTDMEKTNKRYNKHC